MKLSEMIARRAEIVARSRQCLADMEGATAAREAALGAECDELLAELDALDVKIDRHSKTAVADARNNESLAFAQERATETSNAAMRPVADASARGDGNIVYPVTTGWADDKGNEVRTLRPQDSWATSRVEGLSMGDTLRALVTGPRNDAERRALSEGTDSAGGYTVPAPLAAMWIDKLRAQSVAIRAGAVTVPMTSQTLDMARLETDPTIGWRAESASIATGDPTFGRVQFVAKSLAGYVKMSRELAQDSVNISAILESAFVRAMALELDRAAIFGDGSNDSPTGIINTSGINEVSMGTNGASLSSYDKLLDAIYEMQLDNAADPTAAIMHPRTNIALAKMKTGDGYPVPRGEILSRVPFLTTTAAPINETQGSASTASSIVFGDYRMLLLGMREQITIEVDRHVFATTGEVALIAHMRADVQLGHKVSFSRLKGIIP